MPKMKTVCLDRLSIAGIESFVTANTSAKVNKEIMFER